MSGNRAMSDVVSTVLIVLITIAAAALLFSMVIPFIKDSLAGSTECVQYQQYFTFEEKLGYTCYDASNLHSFSVRAKAAGDAPALSSIDIVLIGQGTSKKVSISAGNASSSAVGGVRMLDKSMSQISIPGNGEVQTFVYNAGTDRYQKIELYPVMASGKVCDRSDEISISSCKGVTL